jgi:murein L,D-transpeptidase YafK
MALRDEHSLGGKHDMPMPFRGHGRCSTALCLAILVAIVTPLPAAAQTIEKADRILVLKAERELQLLRDGALLKSYPIALGKHPKGPKRRQGDGRTPEGIYFIDGRLTRTLYHLALHISYPSDRDKARARAAGERPGGDIVIHGMPARFGHTDPVRFFRDWTNGCISVGNVAIEEIWDAVADGTPIEIRP